MDPFDHPVVGTEISIPFGDKTVTLKCSAWGEEGSRWQVLPDGQHYTNGHTFWIEKYKLYSKSFAKKNGALV